MKDLDTKGAFESDDDETGFVFKQLYEVIEKLEKYYAEEEKNKRYFTKITEIAINAYNSIDDYRVKE